ncbi:roundabout homolog 2-like [Macrobrachium rosenbergii]|uniref:roundabout homolog 2-like n=1 Tax=Macrobrachium rosenbergii TaxID=79674 RepID=UPI0034D41361
MKGLLSLLLLVVAGVAEEDLAPIIKEHPSSIVTPRNEPATLNCAAARASRITWFRDGEEVVTSSQDPRSHRVFLPSGSLFFLRVSTGKRDSDAGTYWCVASNKYGSVQSRNATLTVATLSSEFQREPEPLVKARVGESVTLSCRPPKGFPTPDIVWLRNKQEVTNSSRVTVTSAGDLVIDEAVKEDSANYVCRAHNVVGAREARPSKLTVMTPPWFEERPANLTVVSGTVVELACGGRGSPMPQVTWRRLDGKMPLGRAMIEDQRLILQQVSAIDSGVYVCEIESEAGVATATATLTVVDAPKLIQRPQDHLVLEGDPVQLSCSVEGDPEPLLLWRLPTESRSTLLLATQSNGNANIAENGQALFLNKSATDDTGLYKCWGVSNGGGVSAQAQIIVVKAHPPPVIGIGPKDQTVAPGGGVTFPCEGVSESAEPTLTWWFRPAAHLPSRRLSESTEKPRVSIAENGALILRELSVDDAGIYKCVAEASTGKVEQEAILRVSKDAVAKLPSYLPAPPSKPRVMAVTETSVYLSWLPNSHVANSTSQGYVVEHWRLGWEEWRIADATVEQESCVVMHLTPGQTYTFLIRAVNGSGTSFPSPWSDPVTTHDPEDDSITAADIRHAQRRLSRSILTLVNASAVTPDSVFLKWEFLTPVEDSVEGVLAYAVSVKGSIHLTTVYGFTTQSSYTMQDLHPNTAYTFFLVPFWRKLEGTPSNSHSLTTPEDVPVAAPSDVRVTLREDGSTLITWTPLSTEEARGKVIGYHVTLTHNGTHITETVPSAWLEARGLTNGRLYTVRVAAITGAGHGPFSAPLLMDAGPGNTQTYHDVHAVNSDDPNVIFAQAQTGWLIYLLIPLVIVMFFATLFYIRRLHQKTPPSIQHPPPTVYQDPSIYPAHHSVNMYSEQKLWRPGASGDSSMSSGLPPCPDQMPNEYAEPRLQQANETAEPYATTALLVPASPRLGRNGGYWRGPHQDPNLHVNWNAFIPPPPVFAQPATNQEHPSNCRMCIATSQYDNVGSSQQYNKPCDAASDHTYEPYSQVAPVNVRDKFPTFNSLQAKGRQKACDETHSAENKNPPHSNTH